MIRKASSCCGNHVDDTSSADASEKLSLNANGHKVLPPTSDPDSDTESAATASRSANTSPSATGQPVHSETQDLQLLFNAFDENHDGHLSSEELSRWMKKLGLEFTTDGMLKLVNSADWNKDGRLDFMEFVALNQSLQNECAAKEEEDGDGAGSSKKAGNSKDSDMEEAFKLFDKDGNGLISPKELSAMLSDLGLLASGSNLSRVQSMIKKVDTDGDGQVSFKEFESMMNGNKLPR